MLSFADLGVLQATERYIICNRRLTREPPHKRSSLPAVVGPVVGDMSQDGPEFALVFIALQILIAKHIVECLIGLAIQEVYPALLRFRPELL